MLTLEQITQPISKDLVLFDEAYRQALSSQQELLNEALKYVHQQRGKLIRPILTLLAAQLCHSVSDKTIDTAVAMEMLHTASLIHDDVVDDSPTRRSQPAIHAKWTNKIAVLVGDYIFAKVLIRMGSMHNNRILLILSDMVKALVEGELTQLHYDQSMFIDEVTYFDIIEHKTARLFAACAEAGAASALASPKQISALKQYGLLLGLCFQLKDDILDYSDAEDIGKPTLSDIRDGKVTLPLIVALQRAPQAEAEATKKIITEAAPRFEQSVLSFVLRYDCIGYANQKMQELRAQAVQALDCFHDSLTKESLIQLLTYSINRLY